MLLTTLAFNYRGRPSNTYAGLIPSSTILIVLWKNLDDQMTRRLLCLVGQQLK